MEIQEQQQGAVVVLRPVGPLIQAEAEAFRARMQDALGRSLGRVVLDAAAVPFVDSAGLEALVHLSERLAEGGRALKLCGANEMLREVFELTGWGDAFEYFADAASAARSFL